MPADHPSVIRVRGELTARGGAGDQIRILDSAARTAAEAAEQLGVGVAQIANSLLFDADGAPLLVMASGGHRVDTTKVAEIIAVMRDTGVRRLVVVSSTGAYPYPNRIDTPVSLRLFEPVITRTIGAPFG